MFPAEVLNEIVEDPISDWGDEVYFEEDDDFDELHIGNTGDENDQKTVIDLNGVSLSSRPTTTKSIGSSLRSDGKRVRMKQQRRTLYSFGSVAIQRDPIVDTIIESRKMSIIENPYTRLAQITSQLPRLSQRGNQFEVRPVTAEGEDELKDRISTSENGTRVSVTKTAAVAATITTSSELDKAGWDDGLTGETEKEKTPSIEKSCSQLYEETCKRLNVCPCSLIIRSLNTTHINLRNYGLGPRGCASLAVGLVRNTTVLSLNLSQNNIGSHGMSHIYQILMENSYIEEYDLSFNNLGTKGICKLAAAIPHCTQMKTLSVAGNEITASDIEILLLKLEDHINLKTLNISHNQLEEEGGNKVAKWLSDNNPLQNLDISWCSIRLTGTKTLAKSIGDNHRLISLNLSHNSFTNDTIDLITNSLIHNTTLCELNLRGNQLISRFDGIIKETPTILLTGKDYCQLYKMIVAAATNQSLKIFRLGQNHIDARCLMIILESLSKLDNITLEELDLTGLTMTTNQISKIHLLFTNHSKLKCFVGPVRQMTEHFANNLLNLINTYCQETELTLSDMFHPNDGISTTISVVTYEQFLNGLRRAKIPFPIAFINDIMKYLGRDNEEGLITLRSLIIV